MSGGPAATVQLLYVISGHLRTVGGLFFGLWLIPMGWLVVRSQWLPQLLAQVLMVGGADHVAFGLGAGGQEVDSPSGRN